MADPYLEPADVRERISRGGTALAGSEYPDEWVASKVRQFERKLEKHTGDCYVERDFEWTDTVRSHTRKLIVPYVHIADVTVEVDGDEITLDEHQPQYRLGIIAYAGGFWCGQTITATGTRCNPDTDLLETAQEACALWIEREAAADRSANTPAVSRQTNEFGGTTVFIQPDPEASPPRLTPYPEVNDLVNDLPRYRIPGVA